MRQTVNINKKWAFSKYSEKIPETFPKLWNLVNLPHTWNAIDGQDGNNDYFRGKCYYAKEVKKSEIPTAEQYFLEINGANSSADVYLNGEKLAHHDGGYSTWRVNLSEKLKDENLLVITTDNSRNENIYPQAADFTFYGGLYRDVRLICTPKSHFELEYYGTDGIKVTTETENGNAHVEIELFVANISEKNTVRCKVSDRGGNSIYESCSKKTVFVFDIPEVHLWQGRNDPYLYTAEAVLYEDDKETDTVRTEFGCRNFNVDPNKGFILNGEEYPLRGVSRHQDRAEFGNALLPEHHVEDIELICEVGANCIRAAHYQQSKEFYELCDKKGLIVWAEIPYITKNLPGGRENALSQMKELVLQNYNHPSVCFWGLSNEITAGGISAELIETHKILNELCHSLDKTRLTTVAAVTHCPDDSEYLKIPDLVAYNHYFGWYGGNTAMNGEWFDKFHARHPSVPIACSEYGCEALNLHSSNPEQGDYTEEYQAFYHEELIKQLFSRKYLWATYVWNMFDFGADARNEGGENGQNHKGLVTFDRKYKKDAFYAYKAWLSKEPFVHICGKRYKDRTEDITNVTVYSNLPEVELFANGESLGKKTAADRFFRFSVPNTGCTKLLARAQNLTDTSVINKVSVFNEDYRLKEQEGTLRTEDVTRKEGFFSLCDKIGDILENESGKKLFEQIFYDPKRKKETSPIDLSKEMFGMLKDFTFLRLLNTVRAFDMKFTKDEIEDLNRRLNSIRK